MRPKIATFLLAALALLALAALCAQPLTPPPGMIIGPDGEVTKPRSPGAPAREPIPESGSNDFFDWERSADYPGVFVLYPNQDPEQDPFLVSEGWFNLNARSSQLDDERLYQVLQSYSQISENMYEQTMTSNYPDASVTYEEEFENVTLVGSEGSGLSALIEQDDLASPYVQVTLEIDGEIKVLSLARSVAERLLTNDRMTDDKKIQALGAFPFTLPDEARERFGELTQEELRALVAELPAVERQEFMRMHKVFQKEEEQRLAAAAAGEAKPLPKSIPGDRKPLDRFPDRTPKTQAAKTPAPSGGPAVTPSPIPVAPPEGMISVATLFIVVGVMLAIFIVIALVALRMRT